jgi:hypothetical protein
MDLAFVRERATITQATATASRSGGQNEVFALTSMGQHLKTTVHRARQAQDSCNYTCTNKLAPLLRQ